MASTFGALENDRYEAYAQDITTAGQEIAALVDELDDYARLRDGRYLPQRTSIDLTSLLESCVVRIRKQASGARVIVRNAISESLPRVTADRQMFAAYDEIVLRKRFAFADFGEAEKHHLELNPQGMIWDF